VARSRHVCHHRSLFAARRTEAVKRRRSLRGAEPQVCRKDARACCAIDAQGGLDDIRAGVDARAFRAQSDGVFAAINRMNGDGVIATGARQNVIHRTVPLGLGWSLLPCNQAF